MKYEKIINEILKSNPTDDWAFVSGYLSCAKEYWAFETYHLSIPLKNVWENFIQVHAWFRPFWHAKNFGYWTFQVLVSTWLLRVVFLDISPENCLQKMTELENKNKHNYL